MIKPDTTELEPDTTEQLGCRGSETTSMDVLRNHVANALDLIERLEAQADPNDDFDKLRINMIRTDLAMALASASAESLKLVRWT